MRRSADIDQKLYPDAEHARKTITLGEHGQIGLIWYRDRWGVNLRIMPFDAGPSIELHNYDRVGENGRTIVHVGGQDSFGSPGTLRRWAAAIGYAAERLEAADWLNGIPQ